MSFDDQNSPDKKISNVSLKSKSPKTEEVKEEGFVCWFFDSICAFLSFGLLISALVLGYSIFISDKVAIEVAGKTFSLITRMQVFIAIVSCGILSFAFFQIRRLLRNFRC